MALNLRIEHLVVIGVGLIGGSLVRALRRAGVVGRVSGIGRSRENLELAVEQGVIDDYAHAFGTEHRAADMVVVAVPMGGYAEVFAQLAEHMGPDSVLTDAGSTKQHALDMAARYLSDTTRFVPAHPIAGTEQSGVGASFASLYDHHWCILTPGADTDAEALKKVEALWQTAGAKVAVMDAATHDDLLAGVSHLPHMAAFALVNAVRRSAGVHEPLKFAAGGFRDFTRIASSSPEMWRDIVLYNRDAMLQKIDAMQHELSTLRRAVQAGDGETLLKEFQEAKAARDAWLAEKEKES